MRKTRKCAFCGKEFTCNSGSQRYCSEHCAEAAKAQRKKRQQDFLKAVQPVIDIASQEYLTFSKAAILMGCSRQYVYKLVNEGKLPASRISSRMAFVRKADIEKMLAGNPYHRVLSNKPCKKSSQSSYVHSSLPPCRHVNFSLKLRLPTRRQPCPTFISFVPTHRQPSRSIRFPLPPRRQQTFCSRLPLPTHRQANFRRHFPLPTRRHKAFGIILSANIANNPQSSPFSAQNYTKSSPF